MEAPCHCGHHPENHPVDDYELDQYCDHCSCFVTQQELAAREIDEDACPKCGSLETTTQEVPSMAGWGEDGCEWCVSCGLVLDTWHPDVR